MRTEAVGRPAESDVATRPFDWPAQAFDAREQQVVALDRERKVVKTNRRIDEQLSGDRRPDRHGGLAPVPRRGGALAQGRIREARDFRIEAEGRELTLLESGESDPVDKGGEWLT